MGGVGIPCHGPPRSWRKFKKPGRRCRAKWVSHGGQIEVMKVYDSAIDMALPNDGRRSEARGANASRAPRAARGGRATRARGYSEFAGRDSRRPADESGLHPGTGERHG